MNRTNAVLSLILFAGASAAFAACAAGGDSQDETNGSSAGAGAGGAGEGGGIFDVDGGTEGGLTEAGACAAENNPGVLVPLDLYVMLDQSASMDESGKWSSVINALQTFVASPESDGIGIGIQYFPVPPPQPIPAPCAVDADCGLYGPCMPFFGCAGSLAQDTSCDVADYDDAEVPIGVLPDAKDAILASLAGHGPTGSATPSQPAMGGAVSYATAWAAANPTHLTYIVFATDGEPTGCSLGMNSVDGTAALAAAAAAGDPTVQTFVIGVGSGLGALNQIAAAGGTGQAYLVGAGSLATQQFIDALNEIRSAGACKFQIPVPEQGTPDYQKVNVVVKDPSAPGGGKSIVYRQNALACDPVTGGWYYDSPGSPTMILLCEATCAEVQALGTSVDVLLGCATILE